MTKMQAQCMSPTSAAAGGVGTLKGLPAKAPCSPAHNCYLPVDHSRPSKHAHHGQSHSQVFKTKGNLYTWACFSACLLPFLHSVPSEFYRHWATNGIRTPGHTFLECHRTVLIPCHPSNTNKTLFTIFSFFSFFYFRSF